MENDPYFSRFFVAYRRKQVIRTANSAKRYILHKCKMRYDRFAVAIYLASLDAI